MPVFGYCRVSTARQANEGESLDVQRRQTEGYAHMHGLVLDQIVIEEGVSGSMSGQPPARCSPSCRRATW
jgi:putative DNA-invertase from lambdoid prophage Rac